ncbi:helix-turn-helix domain-containing protein [Marinomonas sp. TI.3.20]|uniref:helix-turn-helix domain-containing protein n=1 Tax=Marinomonas sp. TI.3.20 TaxID=3121296 RepID=UPI00311DA968
MTKEWIPNIDIGQDYDASYNDAIIHFDKLGHMADFFGRDMPMHLHAQFCQIHLVKTGKTLFNIDQNNYETNGCAIFYTPPATPHAFLTEPSSPGYVITIHSSFLQTIMSHLDAYRINDSLLMPFCISQEDSDADRTSHWDAMSNLFAMLKHEWKLNTQYKSEAIEGIVTLIFINMLRLCDAPQAKKQHNHSEVQSFRAFSTLVENHFSSKKQTSFYCEQLNINDSRLHYICKKIANISPKKIINGRALLEAKRLLSHTNMNLTEISYTLGYIDPSYFSRFFIKNIGVSPSEFRQKNRHDQDLTTVSKNG